MGLARLGNWPVLREAGYAGFFSSGFDCVEATVSVNAIFSAESRDGELARALNVALHALVVHSGMRAISEGEEIDLDFAGEIETVRRALALLGVDPSETLPYLGPMPASQADWE